MDVEKKFNIVFCNGIWVLVRHLTIHNEYHRLGQSYQKVGNYFIGTNPDKTHFAICVISERIRKYGVFTKFFIIDVNRIVVLEKDNIWKVIDAETGEKSWLGSRLDDRGKLFIYHYVGGVKLTKIEGNYLQSVWYQSYQRGLNRTLSLCQNNGISELVAV